MMDGPCGPCQHNTTGPHCERCLPGHYGNPVQGACKPCACPLYEASNNFSPNCALASAEGDEYVCTQCPDGYIGDHCENLSTKIVSLFSSYNLANLFLEPTRITPTSATCLDNIYTDIVPVNKEIISVILVMCKCDSCDFGYWGSPTTPGGRCQACECGGSPCHPATGRCLTCPPHTEGARCDLCKEGYWFGEEGVGPSSSGCVQCACGAGALSGACDARTGHCACRAGWTGRACDTCLPGYGGVSAGCPVCRCGTAALNATCDAVSGECACAPGAAPPSCDTCLDEHYGLDSTGCKAMLLNLGWTLGGLEVINEVPYI
ncbi:hypothetical protein HW555_001262 [Spodoptera exigua]|uniref:Laminin EGF-like domain-containing protein n=1 Tax=Spodoptera exigua TaxID=7107 RepID=A0A835LFM7_SPOEX|nr:hypothetical protein HW555_001262 [Spodoptera exigua]